jgi:aspartyl-tRNA(Asn)/glutamyl-tRNA(Gln) amidotransferase subunit A
VTAERALADARDAEREIGRGGYRGPLHGIPIGLKDLYATAGVRTTAGSKILADWVPTEDSTVARKLRQAGAVLLGKLNTHEFAYGGTTINPHYGPTRNPWDPARVPGGSSGGSGAAIAARLALGTMGSDTAGSIRIPAALCGVVGLMPTNGRVSKAGVVPLSWTYDHAGPLTRTVEDAALMLQAVAGYDPADPTTLPLPAEDFLRELGQPITGLRVGVPRAHFYEALEDDVRSVVEEALAELRRLGATLIKVDVEVPDLAERLLSRRLITRAEAGFYHARNLRERPQDFGPEFGTLATPPSAEELIQAHRDGDAATVALRTALESVDVLATPTVPQTAPLIEPLQAGAPTPDLSRCTAPFNQAHLPALSVPCGFTSNGLPVGLQLAGRPFAEALILRVGHAYEQATDWHRRLPPACA